MINRFGFDLVKIRNIHDNLSRHLWNVLVAKNIECVIDVGANSGQYGQFLRKLGYEGYIVSFEPVASVFSLLKQKCAGDAKWSCAQLALGDKSQERVINVYKSTEFSSFLNANEYSKDIWNSLKDEATHECVKVVRLDDVYDELIGYLGCTKHMLKLDTQGYDKWTCPVSVDGLSSQSKPPSG